MKRGESRFLIKEVNTRRFLKISVITGILIIPLKLFFDLKVSMVILVSVLLFEAFLVWKEKILHEAIIAFLFAMIITSYYVYEYTTYNIFIGRINLFPLICWTAGLVLTREIYVRINKKYRFLATCLIYWTLLLLLEYVFYQFFNVRLNSDYPGLFGLNLMHAEKGMKFFYLFAGPLYILLTDYLKLK